VNLKSFQSKTKIGRRTHWKAKIMRTLVTGASGFIGQSLLSQHLTGEIHLLSRSKLNTVNPNYLQHIGDLQDREVVKKLADLKFDRVVHLAWQGLPELTDENNKLNLLLSKNFVKVMIDSGVSEVNLVGSCLEYGDLDSKVDESSIGTNIGEFGEAKLDLLDFVSSQEIKYRWLRVFYAYGPNQHRQSLLSAAYESVLQGVPLNIRDPRLARDFIYVDDVSRAIRMLLDSPHSYGVFNVGSGKSTGVGELVYSLQAQMNLPSVNIKEYELSLRANYKKIELACGWRPQIGIEQGVSEFIQWREQK
jgi:nucleoside-diphosphate-sugar epimerase